MRWIGGERSHAAAWVEARGELRENFNTISNREEGEVEGGARMRKKHEKTEIPRHKAQSEVAFDSVVREPLSARGQAHG